MFGLLKKFRDGLKRTTESLWGRLGGLWGQKTLSLEELSLLEEALYGADFGVETVEEILAEVKAAYKNEKSLQGQEVAEIGARVLERILAGAQGQFSPRKDLLEVICLVGVNGAGKTTTAAKLGYAFQQSGHPTLLGACDTFRAAANEQIKTWCGRLNLDLVSSHMGADSAAVAFDACSAAKARAKEVLILDTAGRLHTKTHLMGELQKLQRVLERQQPGAPQHRWLVVDATLGANSIVQARTFHEAFGLTGLILTKLDGSSRGGALVGIYRALKLPIYYVGLGEQVEDLHPFRVSTYIETRFKT